MELYLNATSPYARVARIVALERGLTDDVSLRWCDPWVDDEALLAINPASRVPALVTDEGATLSESLLIAQYLNARGNGIDLLPDAALAEVLSHTGFGQGLIDAAFTTVIARKNQGAAADESVLGQRRERAIARLLATLEGHERTRKGEPEPLMLGDIVVGVALDYLSFRLPEVDWPSRHRRLAAWHRALLGRESFRETAFA
ncbi:glutathione S-transferase family protein [Halomonas faecis]|uniref:glutathione S-transferase family protein n=1 Tax=Halomonas faecis TaxID=1562110 RepID=UPI0013D0BEB6|nr:glutathione S-transferase N-terminal domain-containing protein [Halomonas faecis]